MNDRYLFRGKRVQNKGWVEGSLVIESSDNYRIATPSQNTRGYYIVPETVAQCTGLKDKNDKLIFEGDVIERNKSYFIVIWNKEELFWEAKSIPKEDCIKYFNLFLNEVPFCEIIGNKWDNPELL